MKERIANVTTKAGHMPTFVTHPEENGPFPPIVIFMDVWGVREELFDIARRIGTVGYCVLVPDFYYRQGTIRQTYIDADGKRISLAKLSPEEQAKITSHSAALTDGMLAEDVGALIGFLDSGDDPVKRGGIGSVGYCMGGRHVQVAGVSYPERFIASASLHGTYLISDKPDSSHKKLKDMRGEYYCGFAEFDHYAPLDMVEELDEILKHCSVAHRAVVHPGAVHGYALPDRDIYDKRATDRDWELIFAMWHRQIPPYAA
jgi:carboxymethylenebutenolidase